MKDLLKIMAALAACFALTFFVIKLSGVFTLADIEQGLARVNDIHPGYVFALVVFFLFADLFVAVPTMSLSLLAGYLLGGVMGSLAVICGVLLAGFTGYGLSWVYGRKLLDKIYPDAVRRARMDSAFARYGAVILIICRALPMLPEVSCCMAGATRMPFGKFALAYGLGSIPYACLIASAGAASSLNNPQPAILVAISLSLLLWSAWWLLLRNIKQREKVSGF